jgi:putative MATE family efflux protein
MGMESAFAITDAFFVSRLGNDAVATIGLTEAIITLIFAIAMGMSMGTTAMVARRIGEKNRPAAGVAAVQSLLLGLGIAAVTAIPGIHFAPELLGFMGGSRELVAAGSGYTAVMLGGSVTLILLTLLNAVFRGAGDAAAAMRVLWLANGINIVLDPCLIFGLGPFPVMGVTGAAVATTVGRGTGVLFQFWILFKGTSRIKLVASHVVPDWGVMAALVRVSMGGILQFLIGTASWVFLIGIIGRFGSAVVAGYTIAIRIIVFAILPAWGLSNAAATLVGQNLGAKRPDRAEASVWKTGFYNMLFLVSLALVLIVFAPFFIGIFSRDSAVIASGVDCLRCICYGYGFYAYGMVMLQAFNGAGDTFTPTIINLICYWCLQIPAAYIMVHNTAMGATGVYLAITVTECLIALIAIFVFRTGRWKLRAI